MFQSLGVLSAFTVAGITGILYAIVLGIWRVYFSPLSKFPGPKLAGLTYCMYLYSFRVLTF
jgi:hypothetical protein